MKLRLEIDAPEARSFEFDGSMTEIRLGRDPQCAVPFLSNEHEMVSWEHALIELKPGGAFLSDCGSTNGTLLNDRRIERRMQIQAGDAIRLGQTGPQLRVAELELASVAASSGDGAAPVSADAESAPARLDRSYGWLAGAAAAAALLFLSVLVIMAASGKKPVEAGAEAIVIPAPPQPPPIDLAKWTDANLILADDNSGGAAIKIAKFGEREMFYLSDRAGPAELPRVLEAAWEARVPIVQTLPAVTREIAENISPNAYLPEGVQGQIAALFPTGGWITSAPEEMVTFIDSSGSKHSGYRLQETGDGFLFRAFHESLPRMVHSRGIRSESLAVLNPEQARDQVPVLAYALLEVAEHLAIQAERTRFVQLAVAVEPSLPQHVAQEVELRLQRSTLQYELRPDLVNFPIVGRSRFRRVNYAAAREQRLLSATHLLLVSPAAEAAGVSQSAGDQQRGQSLLVRLVDLATGNTEWSDRGSLAVHVPPPPQPTAPLLADAKYLLHSGQLAKIEFHHQRQIPDDLISVRRGFHADQDFCVAFVESRTASEIMVRHLFRDRSTVVPASDIKSITPLDPDELLAVSDTYDPVFGAWRIARHLLLPAGYVAQVELPHVEISLGRNRLLGADRAGSLVTLQRLPEADETESIRPTHLPVRMRVVDPRETKTIAELLDPSGLGGEEDLTPRVGDIAIVVPPHLLPPGAELANVDRVRRLRVAVLQVRTTTSGASFKEHALGGIFDRFTRPNDERLAVYARRMTAELEGALIRHGCEVADHQQFWQATTERSKLSPRDLAKIVTELVQSMDLTHVVQAEFVHAVERRERNYAVFTCTEVNRTAQPIVGRQVAKIELEFP